MKLEDIVCDFEYAEKLKEFGVNKSSIFSHLIRNGESAVVQHEFAEATRAIGLKSLNTYTVAELGEMLPREIYYCAHRFQLFCKTRQSGRFDLAYYNDGCCQPPSVTERLDKKEANVRAKLLIWLLENNHITAEELNK